MKKLLLFSLLTSVSVLISAQQNVGIGTNNPQTKLQVEGAISSTPVSAAASSSGVVIPDNATNFQLTAGSGPAALSVAHPQNGQFLNIENDDTHAATFAGFTIPAGGLASFLYLTADGAWKQTSNNNTGSNAFNSGNGLSWSGTTLNSNWTASGSNIYNNNTGNVGIGTPTPTSLLQVNGGLISVNNAAGETPYQITGYNNGASLWMISGNATTAQAVLGTAFSWDDQVSLTYTPGTVGAAAGLLQIGQINKNNANYTHGITSFYTNGLERARINSAGYVGVATTNPLTQLQVSTPTNQASMTLGSAAGVAFSVVKADEGYGLYTGISGNGDVWQQAGRTSSAIAYNMLLEASGGNVGIATTSPKNKLDVSGAVAIGSYAGAHTATANNLIVSGNVGVGTPTPSANLQVVGGSQTQTSVVTDGYMQAVGGTVGTNLVPSHSWVPGTNGPIGIFNENGSGNDDIEWGVGPYGNEALLWKAFGSNGGADGGWNTNSFNIDNTKMYRVSCWVKRTGSLGGTTYIGCGGNGVVYPSTGATETNPYFYCGVLPQLNRWYLVAGYIHGSGDASTLSYGGVYDGVTGQEVIALNGGSNCTTDFKFTTSCTQQQQRAYMYYNSTSGTNQFFYDPRFEEVNGSEPSIGSFLSLAIYAGNNNYIQNTLSQQASANFNISGNGYLAGNAGIGTAAPATKAEINLAGASALTTIQQNLNANALAISTTYGSGGNYFPGIEWYTTDQNPTRPKSAIWSGGDGTGSRLFFGTSNSYVTGVTNTAITIDPLGNVGIGTTAPASALHSAGQVSLGIPSGGSGGASASNGSLLFYNSSNSNTVTIQSSATSGTYTLNLPTAQGGAGQVLANDGSGNLGWENNSNPWVLVGSSFAALQEICAGGTAATIYEWGVTYNNSSPIIRVTCNGWDIGSRVCTYPPYPTGDAPPFTWGGACWIWGITTGVSASCTSNAYEIYYMQNSSGVYGMTGGNGCGSLPTVYQRVL